MFRNSNCGCDCFRNSIRNCCCGEDDCCCRGPVGPRGPAGPMGPRGLTGTGTTIQGTAESKEQLDRDYPDGPPEHAYIIDGVIYIWNEAEGWHGAGSLEGPAGPQGAQGAAGPTGPQGIAGPAGPQGTGTTIQGAAESKEQLDRDYPDGPPEHAYLVDGELYIWNSAEGWHSAGNLKGPAGTSVLQFSSVSTGRVQSSPLGGGRSTCCMVGLGNQSLVSLTDPVLVSISALSLKILEAVTITEIEYSLSLALAQTDITSEVFVQLYSAPNMTAREFSPVPGTLAMLSVPNGSPEGTLFTERLTNLSIEIPAGTQLLLGLYNTSESLTSGVDTYIGGAAKTE